jgi:hypothetical protein
MQLTKLNRYIRTRIQFGINIHINANLTILSSIRNVFFSNM